MNEDFKIEFTSTHTSARSDFDIFNDHADKRKAALEAIGSFVREIEDLKSNYYINKLPTTTKFTGIFTVGISLDGFWSILLQIEAHPNPMLYSLDLDFGYFDPIQENIIKGELYKLLKVTK